jgi:2-polyprenyl-3-methyl-5-hydroxy-6-metoxy-1,4-benzoquinol methylase
MSKPLIDKEIDEFYSGTSENDRLKYGLGPLEFERNKDLIQRFLPKKSGTIIDVGGGPGIYSEWLAKLGYDVHLVDPVQKHILQAEKRASKPKSQFKCYLGEAGNLDFEDNFADLIICHGPLYHLQNKEDRIKTLLEAKRVLKPSGILLGFAINYTASTIVGLLQGAVHNPDIFAMCVEEITTGNHHAPESMPGILPKAFYHKPQELLEEVAECGLKPLEIFAVEGIIWLEKNYFESMGNPQKKANLFNLLKLTETDRNLLSFSPHMMIAASKL